MNKREKEILQLRLDAEDDVLAELEKQYRIALNDINRKIRLLMSDELTQSRIYQLEYQKALKGQIEGILEKLHGDEFSTIQKYLHDCYEDAFIGTVYDMAGQGIPLIMPIDQAAAVKAIMTDSKVSGGLYNALSVDVKKLKTTIRQEITRGIATGQTYSDIARNIREVSNVPFSNAKRIARTEGHRIQQASTMDAQEKAKAKGADVVKQWDATLDGGTRPTHRKLDSQIREVDEPFEMDGMKAMYPGDFGDPGEDCNCRCVSLTRARWGLDEAELQTLKERAKFFGLDKTKDFEDFKSKYLKIDQKALEKSLKSSTMKAKKSVVKDAIASGEVSKVINADKQNRHIKGSDKFIEGRSYITGTVEDAQKLVDELSGTGTPIMANGKWTHKERVTSNSVIGVHVDQKTKKETKTKSGLIIYSKTGSHIVPGRGD